MVDRIRRALMRRRSVLGGSFVLEEPDDTLVYAVKFGVGVIVSLSAIEIANLIVLHSWNSEAFASITGLSGIVIGVFVGRKT